LNFFSEDAPATDAPEGSEAAAMAAMFKAQSVLWEETQEKMSQLVSPMRVLTYCIVVISNELCRVLSSFSEPLGYPIILVEEVLVAAESHTRLRSMLWTSLCLQAMFAIDAGRKVSLLAVGTPNYV
jgi:hypothetical protein